MFEQQQIASGLYFFTLANSNETWYACKLHHFRDDNRQLFCSGLAPFHRDMRSRIILRELKILRILQKKWHIGRQDRDGIQVRNMVNEQT